MNPLEQEYRVNVQRAKDREFRRVLYVYGVGASVVLLGFVGAAAPAIDWRSLDASRLVRTCMPMVLSGAIPLACLAVLVALARLARWHGDRHVAVATTERERSYRAPIEPANATVVATSRWQRVVRAALVAVIWFAVVNPPRFDTRLSCGERVFLGAAVTLFAAVILLAKRVYGTWRSRRNARLQLKWDRWLESADSCKVGAREWTE